MKKTIVRLDNDMGVRLAIARVLEFAVAIPVSPKK